MTEPSDGAVDMYSRALPAPHEQHLHGLTVHSQLRPALVAADIAAQNGCMTEQPQTRAPLRRSKTDRVFAGVCGGVARTLGVDPIIIRVIAAAGVLLGGAGFFAYVIAWILIPDDDGHAVVEGDEQRSRFGKLVVAVLLAAAALAFLSSLNSSNGGMVAFLALVVIAVVAWQAFGSDLFTTSAQPTAASPAASEQTSAKCARSPVGPVVWNLLLLVAGTALALDWLDVAHIALPWVLALMLAIVGAALVLTAFVGRARGLIALGVILTLFAIPAGVHVDASAGDVTWRPASAANYELGAGTATLDVTDLATTLGPDDTVVVRAHVAMGVLNIYLPDEMHARGHITTSVRMGSLEGDDQPKLDGFGQARDWEYGNAGPTIDIEADVDMGQIIVHTAEENS